MGQPREESDREHRLADEVIVDAYDSIERAMPFEAPVPARQFG